MNELDVLKTLARAAGAERLPPIDVAARVTARLADQGPGVDWPLAMFTIGSAIAAGIVLAFSASAWLADADPFVEMLESLEMVM